MAKWSWAVGEYSNAIELLIPLEKEVEVLEDKELKHSIMGTLADNYRDQGGSKLPKIPSKGICSYRTRWM